MADVWSVEQYNGVAILKLIGRKGWELTSRLRFDATLDK